MVFTCLPCAIKFLSFFYQLSPICLEIYISPFVENSDISFVRHFRFYRTYKSPRGLCQMFLHSIFKNRTPTRTRRHYILAIVVNGHLTTYVSGHVATVALAVSVHPRNYVFSLSPQDKPIRFKSLVSRATLTRRAVLELGVPVISRNLLE